jgi:hypothetical protein
LCECNECLIVFYPRNTALDDDSIDDITITSCSLSSANTGVSFEYMLFDLINDPSEKINLINDPTFYSTKVSYLLSI